MALLYNRFEWTNDGQKLDIDDPKYISNTIKKSKCVRTNVAMGDIIDRDEEIYQCRTSYIHGKSLSKSIYMNKATKQTFVMGMGNDIPPMVPYASL